MSIVNGSIQIANYTQAEWQAWNGVLKSGQIAISTDQFYGTTNAPKYKVGNGVDTWSNLDYHPDTTGGANTASNGLNVVGSDVQMGGALTKDTTVAGGAFDFQLSGVPKANHTTLFESSQDLFDLLALAGGSINGQGMKYNVTFDGNGDPESWMFVKVSDDTNLGGAYNATIGYINLATGEETYCEATPAAINMLVNNGGLPAGISIDRATEKVSIGMNGSERLTIDATETKLPPFAGGGTQMLTVDNAGVVGVGSVPSATPILINAWTIDTPASAVGTAYNVTSYIILGTVTIPANTMQAGDYLIVKGTFGTLAGSGNHSVEAWFTSVLNPAPDPSLSATGRFGSLGSFGTASPRLYGLNFPIFLKAAGAFLMPSGRAIPFGVNAQEGDAFGSFQGSYGGTRTEASLNAGAVNYAVANYIHFAFISANTITINFQGAIVEHYRP